MNISNTHFPPIRAVFLDIDGTLVAHGDSLSEGVKHALQRVQDRGIEIVLCSGRTRYRIMPIASQMPDPPGYVVCSNGSVVMHLGTGHTLYRHLLPIPTALRIVQAILDAGSEPYVFEDTDDPTAEGSRVLFHPDRPVGDWAERPRYRPYASIEEQLPFEPVCVSCFGDPARMRPLAQNMMREFEGRVSIIQSGSENTWGVEFYVANISKQLGLETVAAHLDVNQDEILAIGDHVNDYEMIKWAGVGVAMGNALPEIKAAADWVTADVWEDGVARALERFIL
jgi:Cof subfamily protein (haloacid dehalogenase superfamily)